MAANCLLAILLTSHSAPAAEPDENRQAAIKLLQNYCYDCHTGEEAEGGIQVDFFEKGLALDRRIETVEKMLLVMREAQMPPADYDSLTNQNRVQLIDWIDAELKDFDCGEISRPGRVTIRRLNRIEYNNTIRDLTGLDLDLAKDFPSDDVGDGFDNIGDVLTIPPILMEKYIAAASLVAQKVVEDEEALRRVFPYQTEKGEDLEKAAQEALKSAEDFAFRAYRKPVSAGDKVRLFELMRSTYTKGFTNEQIQQTLIISILSSPQFIYRVEADKPDDFVDGVRPLNDFELATRLSYFLWSTTPDRELLALAKAGKLRTPEQIEAQVEKMLQDPRAEQLVKNFAGQWLQLRDLTNLTPDPEKFPDFTAGVRSAMRLETEKLFGHILFENRSLLELLNADYTFLNQDLAKFYGLPALQGGDFQRVDLQGQRSGILMHASVLLITSNPTRTSPVKRGKWVLDNLLGEPPPPPPPDVPELDESGETLGTLRQQLEQHRANPNCAVCHTKMDALGFGLENFDAIGKWRDKDGRNDIDSSGELPGGRKFDGPVDLVNILAEDKKQAFCRCITEKLLTYALGRGIGVYDRCTINTIVGKLEQNDHRFQSLIKAIATSEPFLMQEQPD
ncbi:MAG: DUF1592 domain-containing protein [Planctomycetota bacterium]